MLLKNRAMVANSNILAEINRLCVYCMQILPVSSLKLAINEDVQAVKFQAQSFPSRQSGANDTDIFTGYKTRPNLQKERVCEVKKKQKKAVMLVRSGPGGKVAIAPLSGIRSPAVQLQFFLLFMMMRP